MIVSREQPRIAVLAQNGSIFHLCRGLEPGVAAPPFRVCRSEEGRSICSAPGWAGAPGVDVVTSRAARAGVGALTGVFGAASTPLLSGSFRNKLE